MTGNPGTPCPVTQPGHWSAAGLLLAALLLAPAAALAAAGKVLFVAGPVTVERPAPVELKKGDPVEAGDVIVTGDKGRAQVLMNDGARIAIRAGSRYRVDEFRMPELPAATASTAVADPGRSVATLIKGGFRTATGAIGQDGGRGYEVRTPIGTLGIRGTDYVAIWCDGDCGDGPAAAAAPPARTGLYLGVFDGGIVFRYPGGTITLAAGEYIFIPAEAGEPEPLREATPWMLQDGAGPLTHGAVRRPQADGSLKGGIVGRRGPSAPPPPPDSSAPGDPATGEPGSSVSRPVTGSAQGQSVDLTDGQLPTRFPGQDQGQGQAAPQDTASAPPTRGPGG